MLASSLQLSPHQRTPSPPPLSASCSSHRSAKLKTSNPCNHRNQQYSIIGLTNAAGTLVERYSYTAYGTLGIYDASGTVRTTSTYANRYTYTGREYDADLKIYHFRARWYDPSTGGFISRDPLGYVDGMSLYRGYFGVKYVDPSGKVYCKCTRSSGFWSERVGMNYENPRPKTEIRQTDESCTHLEWYRKRGSSWESYRCEPIGPVITRVKVGLIEVPYVLTHFFGGYIKDSKVEAGPWSEWILEKREDLDKGALCHYKSTRTITIRVTTSSEVDGKIVTKVEPEEKARKRVETGKLTIPICKGQECPATLPVADYPLVVQE